MRKATSLLVFISLLMPQFAPAAFAYSDDAESAKGNVRVFFAQALETLKGTTATTLNTAVLSALLAVKPSFAVPRRSGVGEGLEISLTEADAKEAISGVAQMLIGSMNALTGGLAITAHEFSQVSRELATAEVVVPAWHAQNVFVSGTSYVSNLLLGMPVRATLNAARKGTRSGAMLNSSESFVVASAHAAEPQDAEWNELAAETDMLKRQFNTEVMLPFFQPPVQRLDMYTYARGARDAFVAAADAATARNGANAVRALEAAAGALTGFMERFKDYRGGALYAGFENLLPRTLYALVFARMLESGGTSPPREEILSDPKALVYRAEQIAPEETARKAAELRGKLRDIEAQLAKNPDAKLLSFSEELRGAIKNLDRLTRAIPFVMQQVKTPTLSCNPLNTDAVLRKVKEFAVATEVNPLLEIYKNGLIADAVKILREKEAKRWKKNEPGMPLPGTDEELIARWMDKDPSQTFQPKDDQSWYKPELHLYKPLPGRLRYGQGPQAAAGIFGVAYAGGSKRKQEIQMVGAYMAEDAFARFAEDCTKPPSTVIDEVMGRLARYIKSTSALSEDAATAVVREQLEKVVQGYNGGLAAVLGAFDIEVYGSVRNIVGNLDTINRSWTATAPDMTKLFSELRAALLALRALGLETTTWIDDIEAVITKQPGKTAPPTSKTLALRCPGKSSQGKDCAPEVPLPPDPLRAVCTTLEDTINASNLLGAPLRQEQLRLYGGKTPNAPIATCGNNSVYGFACVRDDERYINFWWDTARGPIWSCSVAPGSNPSQSCGDPNRTIVDPCTLSLNSGLSKAPAQCLTGSAAEQEKLLSLLEKCVTKDEKDRVSLAFIWEQAKRFLKAWFLEFLQKEMDNLPKTITADTQSILLGFVDVLTAKNMTGLSVGDNSIIAARVKYYRMLRAAIERIQFTGTTFAPMWGFSAGPKVVDRSLIGAYRGIPEQVFNSVFNEVRRALEPVFAELEEHGEEYGAISVPDELAYADYIVAGAAAARTATILNIARIFDVMWERDGALSGTTLREILSDAIRETRQDAKAGVFLPLGLPYMAASSNLLRNVGITLVKFDLYAFLDKITDPERSTLPVKKLFATAMAIDKVVDALKKLAEKDVEFSESVSACASGVDSGKAIGAALKKITDALPEEKDIEDAYGRDAARELRNLQKGLQSLERSVEGKKGDAPPTVFDGALDAVFRDVFDRLAKETAAALRREQGTVPRGR